MKRKDSPPDTSATHLYNAAAHFIERWSPSSGSERSNYALFLAELCDQLGVDHPNPASDDNRLNEYGFKRAITFDNRDETTSTKFADLYKIAAGFAIVRTLVLKRKSTQERSTPWREGLFDKAPSPS